MKYTIYGIKWADEPHYHEWDKSHDYPHFEAIDRVVIEKEFDSLDAANLWLIDNLPQYAIGSCIKCENGDFCANAVKTHYVCEYGCKTLEEMIAIDRDFLMNKKH